MPGEEPLQAAFAYCSQLAREADRDRYLASLYASTARRAALHALYAFDIEIARIALRVREAMAGELRLQWWREILEGGRPEEARANPVAAALLATIEQTKLPRAPLLAFVDAHGFDLYDDAMESVARFESYASETAGAIILNAATLLGGEHDAVVERAAGHAGAAVTAVAALKHFAAHASRRQLYVPGDLLVRHGIAPNEVFSGRSTPALLSALAEMRAYARRQLEATRQLLRRLPDACKPAFLHVMLGSLTLDRMERRGYDPFTTLVEVPLWRRQWRLWRLARE